VAEVLGQGEERRPIPQRREPDERLATLVGRERPRLALMQGQLEPRGAALEEHAQLGGCEDVHGVLAVEIPLGDAAAVPGSHAQPEAGAAAALAVGR
jgi:hypothetical protein